MEYSTLNITNICQLFDGTKNIIQEKIVLEDEGLVLSYAELHAITNERANLLRDKYNLKPGDPVGFYLERKLKGIIWIIAILKAGGTYVALDTRWPESRLEQAIKLADLKLLITDEGSAQNFNDELNLLIHVDSNEIHFSSNKNFTMTAVEKSHLAYIVFTSGSTGIPKGVQMSHGALLKYLDWERSTNQHVSHGRVLQFFPLSFDISFQEFFNTLVLGGSVIIAPEYIKNDIQEFVKFLNDKKITKLYLPYVFLVELAEYCYQNEIYPKTVNEVISSGEKLLLTMKIKNLFTNMPDCKLVNLYGASEIQVISVYELQGPPCLWPTIAPIGKQIKHVYIHLLNKNKIAVDSNNIGEMYIESECLMSGYLTHDILSNKKFVNVEINGKIKKLYSTGDLARQLPDGNLEYIDRSDYQVKIRGHRIELGEIDQTLANFPIIQQSITLAIDDAKNNKKLVSYIVPEFNPNETQKELGMIFDAVDKMEFKIAQHNIRKFQTAQTLKLESVVVNTNLKKIYFRRKSYRNYHDIEIEKENFTRLLSYLDEAPDPLKENLTDPMPFSYESLNKLLLLLLSIKTDEHSLPKYRYPSAGSLYPVQIYLEIGKGIEGLEPGYYYYHPEQHVIQRLHQNNNEEGIRLYFVGNLDSIEPLYGKLSKCFCFIELGHMLGLLDSELRNQGLVLTTLEGSNNQELFNTLQLNNSDLLLGGYELTSNKVEQREKLRPEIYIYIKKKISQYDTGWYHYNNDRELICLNNTELFKLSIGSDKNYPIFNQAAFALFFVANQNQENALESLQINTGIICQSLMQQAPDYHIGLCPIGTIDNTGHETLKRMTGGTFILAMFGGSVTISQIMSDQQSEAKPIKSIITEEVRSYLSDTLPDYMHPAQIVVLENMPLTLNGKVDRKALPKVEMISNVDYVAPRNELEKEVTEIWADILQLDKNRVGIKEDYFWLGGDSISSIQLVSQLRQRLGININVKDIYNNRTIENLFDNLISKKEMNTTEIQLTQDKMSQAVPEILDQATGSDRTYLAESSIDHIINQDYLDKIQKNRHIEYLYFANSLQQGFIYHALNQGEIDDAYVVQKIWEYNSKIDEDKLKSSWLLAQQRYQSLRLRFAWDAELVQVIDKKGTLDWRYIDLISENDNPELQKQQIKHIQEQDRLERYSLEQGNLFRVYLIKQRANLYTCIFSHHHAILDGWSNSILFNAIHSIYLDLLDEKAVSLSIDDSYQQAQQYLQNHKSDHDDYWYNCISQVEEKIDLNGLLLDRSVNLSDYRYIQNSQEEVLSIKGDLYNQLKRLSQTEAVTLNSVLQFTWHKILHLYGNSKHTLVGTVVSGRNLPINGIEDSVGLYINTLPSVVDHNKQDNQIIISAIKALQDNINEMNARSGVELSKLQRDGKRLFETLFIYDNYPDPISKREQNIRLKINFKATIEKLDYPLVFIVYDLENSLVCTIKYAGELFSRAVVEQLLSTVKVLLKQITMKSQWRTKHLKYLDKSNYRKIIFEWNATNKDFSQRKTIQQLFKEQVERAPNRIAVQYGHSKLTYRELDLKSSQLAYQLQILGIQPNDLVGIYLKRSHLTIVGLMGILKSGGAYVPIDTLYPIDRVHYILQDANLRFVLTTTDLENALPPEVTAILLDKEEKYAGEKEQPAQSHLFDAIYSLYTSGSTGLPKASTVTHTGFLNLLNWYIKTYSLVDTDKVLIISSICFDLTQKNILGILLTGGQVHLVDSEHYDAIKINDQISEQSITILNCAPSAFYGLLEDETQLSKLQSLRKIFLGGEPIIPLRLREIQSLLDLKIMNTYGPTECSDITTAYELRKTDIIDNCLIPIGKPIDNVQVFILTRHLEILPPGAAGELYIGGISVSRGYLNRPGLTAEKFIPNPFQTEEERLENRNSRLYKTGDLARWLADGNIEFIGRIDHQVKLRGFRIELGEIESIIQSISEVKQSVALIREDILHQKRLVVYVTLRKIGETERHDEDRNNRIMALCLKVCKSRLPNYMQPNHILVLNNFPLTPNGKIDRKALPEPEKIEKKILKLQDSPIGLLEEQLANIWKDLLKLDSIGRHDNFFSLGGDSIVSIQMVTRARQKGIILNIAQVFKSPTIAELIACFQTENKLTKKEKTITAGLVPLLPIQIWFFEKADNIHHFNQAGWLVPKAININLPAEVEKLRIVLEALCNHHDAFRLRFRKNKEGWEQYYSDDPSVISFEIIAKADWTEEKLAELCTAIQSNLDIEKGPLSRWVWFEGKGLFCVLHHLIVDGVSWRILLEDLNTLYENKPLAIKSDSYKAWGEYVQEYNTLESTKEYYNNRPTIKLPLEETTTRINHVVAFTKEITQTFIQEAQKAYHTQANDLLLTALVQAVGSYTDYRLCIELEGHGREVLGSELDLTRTIGWFTSLFPVYLELSEPTNLDKSIKEIKEQLRSVPEKGITYGIARYIKQELSEISNSISFNYLGQWDTTDTEENAFKLKSERVGLCSEGNSKLFHKIDILGGVREGILRFEWESNCQESIIGALASNFKEKLEALIMHCSTGKAYGFTPSDFVIKDISQQELDSILNS